MLALILSAAMVLPRSGTPKAVEVSAGAWDLPVDFTAADAPARAVWDFLVPLTTQGHETAPLTVPRGVGFDFRCDGLAQFSGFNFFLVAADGQSFCAKFGPERVGDWERIELRRNDFIPQPSLAAWRKGFKSFTVAAWRNGTGRTALGIRNVDAARPLPLPPPVPAEVVDRCLARMTPPAADELSLVSIHDADAVTDWPATIASVKRWGFRGVIASVSENPVAFEACRDACAAEGVAFHVSVRAFKRTGEGARQIRREDGNPETSWACPSDPVTRGAVVAAAVSAVTRGAAGVHLDFIRYANPGTCSCAMCQRRADCIRQTVAEVRAAVKAVSPDCLLGAAVFPNRCSDAKTLGQDWPRWCREGLLDVVSPMDYIASTALLKEVLRTQREAADAVRLVPYVGLNVLPSGVNRPLRLAEQVSLVRNLGLSGFCVFNFNRHSSNDLQRVFGPCKPKIEVQSLSRAR